MDSKSTRTLARLTVVLLLPLCGCENGDADPVKAADPDEPSAVLAAEVKAIEYVDKIALPGASVHGFEMTRIVAKQAGFVETFLQVDNRDLDIGDSVEQDAVLAVLKIPELKQELMEKQASVRQVLAEVEQAKASITIAQAMVTQVREQLSEQEALRALRQVELQRISRLVKLGAADLESRDEVRFKLQAAVASVARVQAEIVTAAANKIKAEQDLKQVLAAADVAAAAVRRLEALWDYRNIRAPFTGVIIARHVDHGAFVRPAGGDGEGSPLFDLALVDRVRIVAHVPPSLLAEIAKGKTASFEAVGGRPGLVVRGTISRIASALDQKSRKMRIEMHVANVMPVAWEGGPLALGLYGTLSVLRQHYKSLTTVPTAAVGTNKTDGSRFVVVVSGENQSPVVVRVIFDDAETVGIVGEVKQGDRVRIDGLDAYGR